MNSYQQLIAKSRYARYLPEQKRRENWDETSTRWVDFFKEQLKDKINTQDTIWDILGTSINNLSVLPSMRSVMTAGEALKRTHVAAYNCSYLPVDNQRCFDEAMYILLCGTGVGFSCEQQYVNQLPVVPLSFEEGATIVVADSKEGWCQAYRMLIDNLYQGFIPKWDVSLVRPAGAPLKTFGGRASGPGPLIDLFQYTVDKFKAASGRKLKSIEAHDIMCKIGEVVVVGGVRRSAMISLGDLGDYDHATAKAGAWWENHGERALANNSAVYNNKPSIGKFMKELNVEKMSFITLTDGEGHPLSTLKTMSGGSYRKVVNYLRDPITRREYSMVNDGSKQTAVFLRVIKDRWSAATIGFHVIRNSQREMDQFVRYNMDVSSGAEAYSIASSIKKQFREKDFAFLENAGRDEMYLLPSNKQAITDGELVVGSDMNSRQLARQLTKFMDVKKTSRVLLSRFVSVVA